MYRSVETDFPRGVTFFILSFKSILYEKSGVYWEPSDMLNLNITKHIKKSLNEINTIEMIKSKKFKGLYINPELFMMI